MRECRKHYIRTGLFQSWFEHRAVPLPNGKLAIDSVEAVSFILGMIDDPRDFDDPAPPTRLRVIQTNTRRSTLGHAAINHALPTKKMVAT
jgi:hypothetical protein